MMPKPGTPHFHALSQLQSRRRTLHLGYLDMIALVYILSGPVTEPARSVRFQALSSVLAGSAPAANYKPSHPRLTQENHHPANPSRVKEKDPAQTWRAIPPRCQLRGEGQNQRWETDVIGVSEMALWVLSIQVCCTAASFNPSSPVWRCLTELPD